MSKALEELNQIRSEAILGRMPLPSIALFTSQEKKLAQLHFADFLSEEEAVPDALAKTRFWRLGAVRLCSFVTGVGSASMDRILVSAAARGIRYVIGVESCGIVDPETSVGTTIIASSALGDGTPYRYYRNRLARMGVLPRQSPVGPSPAVLALAQAACSPEDPNIRVGRIFSTDLIMHESHHVVKRYARLQCLGADMETATLYAGSAFMGIRALGVLIGADNMSTGIHYLNKRAAFEQGLARYHQVLRQVIRGIDALQQTDNSGIGN